jgi:hypothetical protein
MKRNETIKRIAEGDEWQKLLDKEKAQL